ncbi:MAG TPA: RNA polymerase sigma factor [Candidatus Acidoferrum sp.]|jgi:RNA polymerase sigma-70 factor (ECF subfamily)
MDFEKLHREESGRILATLIRLLGDFDVAEEALQEAYTVALQKWPVEGTPANPRAWLISTARHKAIDRLRRRQNFQTKQEEIAWTAARSESPASDAEENVFPDDQLRLIFTCCHPSLAVETQVALTLRTICGLSTEEISRAFLIPVVSMAQRLVRAKKKIREAGIPYVVPAREDLTERIESVLLVVYLIFNEGYLASSGDALVRKELCAEAISLGRMMCELLPGEAEARALLGLMLLQDSRRDARVSAEGELVLLDEQDRARWDSKEIAEGTRLTESALRGGASGIYALQASIAALHANAKAPAETDWKQIAGLYALMWNMNPSPVVAVNRAVAVAMADGPEAGLALLDELEIAGELAEFHLLPAARADLLRRLGRMEDARTAYERALSLATNDVERRFLRRRLVEIG